MSENEGDDIRCLVESCHIAQCHKLQFCLWDFTACKENTASSVLTPVIQKKKKKTTTTPFLRAKLNGRTLRTRTGIPVQILTFRRLKPFFI